MSNPADRILVALDTQDVARARSLATGLRGAVGGIKLGLEFFSANGPQGVRDVAPAGPDGTQSLPVFLDLKFHDIPNTVAGALRAVVPLRPMIVNVHAAGGPAMLRAARDAVHAAAADAAIPPPLVIAVTVLTSMDAADLDAVGQDSDSAAQVLRLAALTQACGLDGVVCSPREIAAIRAACGPAFKLVVPGIRPAGAETGDQKRVMTPAEALAAGADWLVIGRPITGAPDPVAAAQAIAADLG